MATRSGSNATRVSERRASRGGGAELTAGHRASLYQLIGRGGPFIAFFAMSGETRVIER